MMMIMMTTMRMIMTMMMATSKEIDSGKEVVRTPATLEAGDQLHQDATSSVSNVCLRKITITMVLTKSSTITTAILITKSMTMRMHLTSSQSSSLGCFSHS